MASQTNMRRSSIGNLTERKSAFEFFGDGNADGEAAKQRSSAAVLLSSIVTTV
ncbi:hypothetical protein [Diaphorobacter sp.]|uniref:hypothetical protein n=1 Tax=Diaphorobacter sp. TaxID=1934310 RepID=UPI0028ADD2DC|nr:hypothetical protein [Diaphorobacter sp.]